MCKCMNAGPSSAGGAAVVCTDSLRGKNEKKGTSYLCGIFSRVVFFVPKDHKRKTLELTRGANEKSTFGVLSPTTPGELGRPM